MNFAFIRWRLAFSSFRSSRLTLPTLILQAASTLQQHTASTPDQQRASALLEPAAGGRAVLVQAVLQPVPSTGGAFFEPAAGGRAVLVQAVQQLVPLTSGAFFAAGSLQQYPASTPDQRRASALLEPAAGGRAVLVQAVQQPMPSTGGAFFAAGSLQQYPASAPDQQRASARLEPAAGGRAVLVQAVQQPMPSTGGAFFAAGSLQQYPAQRLLRQQRASARLIRITVLAQLGVNSGSNQFLNLVRRNLLPGAVEPSSQCFHRHFNLA
ncbi:hypothetical protein ISCGN_012283 [Ixodes scapularis]